MKFPVSWLATAGLLSTLLILGYARLHAQPPKAPARPAPVPSLIISTSSEEVLRKVKAAISGIKGDQYYLTENRMVKGKLVRSSRPIGIKDVILVDRAVNGNGSKKAGPEIISTNVTVVSSQTLAKVRAALQGVDAKLFQATLVDSKALMNNGQLVSRGLLLPAKAPNLAPKQGH
jgi:hypothetical protein